MKKYIVLLLMLNIIPNSVDAACYGDANGLIDFKTIYDQFTGFYYETFATNRKNLIALYADQSCLTFEGSQVLGKDSIVEKLNGLTFSKVKHKITKVDSQPIIGVDGNKAVFCSVIGKLMTDDDPEKGFLQTFILRPVDAEGCSYFISNDVFRLALFD